MNKKVIINRRFRILQGQAGFTVLFRRTISKRNIVVRRALKVKFPAPTREAILAATFWKRDGKLIREY